MPLDRRAFLLATPAAAPALVAAAGPVGAAPMASSGGLDATALGVVPDGASEQTTALQIAIDQAAERRLPLVLPPGSIRTSTLTLRPGSRIAGAGPATRMVLAGGGSIFKARAATNLLLTDMSLDGGGPKSPRSPEAANAAGTTGASALIDLGGCERATLGQLEIVGGHGNAIALERGSGRVCNCHISNPRGAGILAIDSTGMEIVHNTIDDCADNAILVWRAKPGDDGTIVANNRIRRIGAASGGSGEYGNGVNIFRAGGVIVSGNRIDDCAYSAVRSNSGSNCQIVNNACRGLGEVAIYAEFAFEGALIAGNLVDDAATGIAITNFNDGGRLAVCSGNIIRNLHTRDHADARGNGISAEADTVITGNLVENAPLAGITLGWGTYLRDLSATNNMIRHCGVGIAVAVADGTGAALISNNLISSPTSNAIQAFEWDKAIGGDLINDTSGRYPNLAISGNLRS